MTISWKLALFLVMFLCGVFKAKAQCMFAQCVCAETFMICRDRSSNITTPLNISADLNKVTELLNNMLPRDLTEIYFTNSPIKVIGDKAFDKSANTIITISFTNCLITNISDAFLSLMSLKYLTITNTKIKEWNSAAMINIGRTIETLFLSNVGFSTWPSWLANFSSVLEFTLEVSSISSIPDDSFDLMIANLSSLSITASKLTSVPKALSKLSNLKDLNLSQNLISNITWLPKSKVLTNLIFNTNNISDSVHLSNSLMPYTNILSTLDLHGNKLSSIPNLSFLNNITTIDLSNNRLSDLVSGQFPAGMTAVNFENNWFKYIPLTVVTLVSMNILDMAYNLVSEIRESDFSQELKLINLDNNLLTELDEGSFPETNQIDSIIFSNNPIATISSTAFKHLTKLTSISLANTRLTRMPLALVTTTSLSSLDFSGSKYLVCTCQEKDLEKLVSSMTDQQVLGNCGLIAIHTFFSELSRDCPR